MASYESIYHLWTIPLKPEARHIFCTSLIELRPIISDTSHLLCIFNWDDIIDNVFATCADLNFDWPVETRFHLVWFQFRSHEARVVAEKEFRDQIRHNAGFHHISLGERAYDQEEAVGVYASYSSAIGSLIHFGRLLYRVEHYSIHIQTPKCFLLERLPGQN
jgi:hypothetical protein